MQCIDTGLLYGSSSLCGMMWCSLTKPTLPMGVMPRAGWLVQWGGLPGKIMSF